jgi:Nif-specific regulatory protein
VVDALKRSGGNMAEAARDLRTTPRILRYKVAQLGIAPKRFRAGGGGEKESDVSES